MSNKLDFDVIKRYCEGNFDEKDTRYIYSLFSDYEGDADFQKHIKDEFFSYLKTESKEKNDLSHILDQIHHAISKNKDREKQTPLKFIYKWYSAAAAVLLLPIIIAGYIWFSSNNSKHIDIAAVAAEEELITSTIHAPLGSRINFTLPDGTVGWLNSGSSLTYSIPFKNNRNVSVAGEVWFDVNKNEQYPFEVCTGTSKIEVTGTKFNVSAYPEEEYVEIILEEGSVIFSRPGSLSKVEMKPNERLLLKDGAIDIENDIDASKYTAWKEGKIIFRGDSMNEVARRIERWYNVEVVLVDEELDSHVIRGIFQDDSLEEVLHFLSMTSPITYQIIDRPVDEDASIQKKKVLIKHKN